MPRAVPRPGGPLNSTQDAAERFTQLRQADPSYVAPNGYEWKGDHYERDTQGFGQDFTKWFSRAAAYGAPAIGGGLALAGGLGPAAATTGSFTSLPTPVAGLGGVIPGGTGASMGGIGGWLGKNGLDLALGAMSLFGGDETPFQKRQSFAGKGLADPSASLNATLAAIQKLAQQWSGPQMPQRPAITGRGPAPVTVPGIPFQIGGGMGFDPSWLASLMVPQQGMNPFQSNPTGSLQGAQGGDSGARRRNPGGNQ